MKNKPATNKGEAIFLAFVVFSVVFGSLPAAAQNTFFSSTTPPEGDPQWSGEENYWRRSSSLIRSRVEQLPADTVQNLPMPILFGVSRAKITPDFGDSRSGGRSHEGQDILAPRGTPIVSPTDAVVLSVGVWTGAGNYVSTANPGGETFVYMHLDRAADIKSGDLLKPGDLIGYVGNTGNAAAGAAHLHFEIRKNGPTDPYPRLTGEFSLPQKIAFATNILDHSTDRAALIKILSDNHSVELKAAQSLGIVLPPDLAAAITTLPARTIASGATTLSADLTLGSQGTAVVNLQNFLIIQNRGPAARALAGAGATGNFGPITRSALIEYQVAARITPADGYYGPLTRAYVEHAPALTPPVVSPSPATPTTPAIPTPPPSTGAISGTVPTRDLTLESEGKDVAWLQTYLIARHAGPASETLAAAGATGYFGNITLRALAEYQKSKGISPAAGYFGALTRAYIGKVVMP